MSFDYTQEEITRLAKENNFTVAGIEKVMRLSNILNDLNNQPEFSGKLLLAIIVYDVKLCHFATQAFWNKVNLVATHV